MAFGVASCFERAFFDVRVFNPCTRSNRQTSLQSTYRRHEQEKKRQYDQRIREVEHSMFTPLVLSTTGGMGRAATTFYKRLATMLSKKKDVPYSKMIGWIRCCMSFSLVRASVMSIRGARSSTTKGALHEPIWTTGSWRPASDCLTYDSKVLSCQSCTCISSFFSLLFYYCQYKLLCITTYLLYIFFLSLSACTQTMYV